MTEKDPHIVDTGFDDVVAGNIFRPDDVAGAPAPAVSSPQPEITAAVTDPGPTSPPGLTQEGKQAALALVALPKELGPPQLAQLAREIAMNIRPRNHILADFKLNETQYEFLEKNHEFYSHALKQACIEWSSPMSTQERLKLEAAAILEDSLVGLGSRMQNRAEGLPGVTEMAKLFAKVAGVGEREAGNGPSAERFVINIDLGADKTIVLSSQAPAQAPPAPRSQLSLPAGSPLAVDLDEI